MSDEDRKARLEANAKAMREIPQPERDAAIEAFDNVLDMRPRLEYRMKQRTLAEAYRKPAPGGSL